MVRCVVIIMVVVTARNHLKQSDATEKTQLIVRCMGKDATDS